MVDTYWQLQESWNEHKDEKTQDVHLRKIICQICKDWLHFMEAVYRFQRLPYLLIGRQLCKAWKRLSITWKVKYETVHSKHERFRAILMFYMDLMWLLEFLFYPSFTSTLVVYFTCHLSYFCRNFLQLLYSFQAHVSLITIIRTFSWQSTCQRNTMGHHALHIHLLWVFVTESINIVDRGDVECQF